MDLGQYFDSLDVQEPATSALVLVIIVHTVWICYVIT